MNKIGNSQINPTIDISVILNPLFYFQTYELVFSFSGLFFFVLSFSFMS